MNLRQGILVLAAALLARSSVHSGEARLLPTMAPPSIELRDQYDAPQKLSFPTTNVTLLTIADQQGSEQVDGWMAALKPRYAGRIDIRGLADCGGAPGFVQSRIRRKFQETRKYPVMMDWSGKVCAQFGCEPHLANILVLGRDGIILARFTGAATPSGIVDANAALDKVLSTQAKLKPAPASP